MAYNKVEYDGKTLIDLTADTVTPETLAKGETAHDMAGNAIVGTMAGGGNTLHITFSSSLAGCEYTVTNGDETITGTVPDDCVVDVAVSGSGTYTVECEGYDAQVEVEDVYNVGVGHMEYFAVYSADDSSLTFYGDVNVPTAGTQYNGKTATTIYEGAEDTGTSSSVLPWYSDRTSFTSVLFDASFTHAQPISCYYWFYGFSNCTAIGGLQYLDTSSVTTMYGMFCNCSQLTSLDVTNFDTSSVTTMYYMFFSCSGLTSLDLGNWDTSAVTTMYGMFCNCSQLTSLDVTNFNTSSVTTMYQMFYKCSGLTSLDVSGWDTSSVTTMSQMFYGCSDLATIYSDDSNFVTTGVTSGAGVNMFLNCSKLVGGNGTAYSSRNVDYTYAHIDTASNPGYFTDINDKKD